MIWCTTALLVKLIMLIRLVFTYIYLKTIVVERANLCIELVVY